MKRYKLTDEYDRTYSGCQWGEGVTHSAPGEGELCTGGWIHVYTHPLLAVLLNPLHRDDDLSAAHLWECKVSGRTKADHELKLGVENCTTVKRIPLPQITLGQKVRFAILCALKVVDKWGLKEWVEWAKRWLSGEDRTEVAADAAVHVAVDAAYAAHAAAHAAKSQGIDLISLAERAVREEKEDAARTG